MKGDILSLIKINWTLLLFVSLLSISVFYTYSNKNECSLLQSLGSASFPQDIEENSEARVWIVTPLKASLTVVVLFLFGGVGGSLYLFCRSWSW